MTSEAESGCSATAENAKGYAALLNTLDSAIASCACQNIRMALLVIDLSRIDTLNAVIGYRETSKILDAVHKRLLEIKRPADILLRVNDSRFALMIPGLTFTSMVELAVNKIVEDLDGLRSFTGMEASIHPNAGVALFPDHGSTADELLLESATAVEAAYRTNTLIVQADSLHHKSIRHTKLLEAQLESAFISSSFELYYQPKVNLQTCKLYGAEALLRWNHPEYGTISPDSLIPVIEKSQLLEEITLWILNTALHQSSSMRERSADFRIAVNLSPELLASPSLVELIKRALRIWNTDPHLLILEITETSVMVNQELSQRNLKLLSEFGILLSIDDFGTGYSSYSYLQQLPVQELKIDKSFITNLLVENNSKCLVSSMIALGRDFGIKVLAEGIETSEVLEQLVDMGCEYGQGFLISKPMPYVEMLEWIDTSGWKIPRTC